MARRVAKLFGPREGSADRSEAFGRGKIDASKSNSLEKAVTQSSFGVSSEDEKPESRQKKSTVGRNEVSKKASNEGKKSKDKGGQAIDNCFARLEKLKSAPADKQKELFRRKMQMCCNVYDFSTNNNPAEKEGKRNTLLELVEHANKTADFVDDAIMSEAVDMVGANIFRTLTKREQQYLDFLDPEDEATVFDVAWPHLEVTYEFLKCLLTSNKIDSKITERVVNQQFLMKLLELFESDDVRERECLKTVITRLYNCFSGLRTCIRRGIQNTCLRASFDGDAHNGIAELLEILVRIISGFKTPLKDEHRDLLLKALIPLHKIGSLGQFHAQLVQCLQKYADKDPKLTYDIVAALLRCWPFSVASKQILFLNETEEMLKVMPGPELSRVQDAFVKRLAFCISCPSSDVAERALLLCKNERVTKLIMQNSRTQFPVIISALYQNTTQHWSNPVHKHTIDVLKILLKTDPELFDHSSAKHRKEVEEKEIRDAERERKWTILQNLHDKKRERTAGCAVRKDRRCPVSGEELGGGCKRSSDDTCSVGGSTAAGDWSSKASQQMLGPRAELALLNNRYGVAASWDSESAVADIGLQAVLVDKRGKIIDAVHDQNISALHMAVWHTQREAKGTTRSCGGTIWVSLNQLPQQVQLLIFVIAASSGDHLCDVADGTVHVFEEEHYNDVAQFVMEPRLGDVGVVAVMKRSGEDTWNLARMDEFATHGRHFMDILEPTLGKLIRAVITTVPKRHKTTISFGAMEQGAVAVLPKPAVAKWIFIGLGWDLSPSASQGVQIVVSAVFFNAVGNEVGAVCPDEAGRYGARHCSKGILGSGVVLDLDVLPPDIAQVFVVGHLSTIPMTFGEVQKPHCCVIDPLGSELMRYTITETISKSGLIMARIVRKSGRSRRSFQAIGSFCDGHTWKQSIEEMKPIFHKAPQDLQTLPLDATTRTEATRSILSL